MSRPEPMGTQLVRNLTTKRPVQLVALKLGVPTRTVYGWLDGRVPTREHRLALERTYGLPCEAWARRADPPL